MFIKAIKNPHRSQQRLGFLKYLVYKASQNDSTPLKILGEDLAKTLSKKIRISLNDSIKEYVKNRLRNHSKNTQEKIYMELQDLYLSDPKIPSKTGKLYSYDSQKRYPYFLSSLGFAREKIYSLLVRGKVFLQFVSKDEINSFNTYIPNHNPLLLNDYQKYVFLYSILENDGDVLKLLYLQLLNFNNSFSDWNAGDYLPEIYEEIAKVYTPNITSGVDRERINHLVESAKKIKTWVNKPRTGGRGAKIDAITPRLEPFVDLGLLEKPDPYKYEYKFTERGREFFNSFSNAENADKFLDFQFFSTLVKSFKLNAKRTEEEEIIEILISAFHKIKSPLGYAPIREIALLGIINSIVNENKYFEIGEAVKLIMEYQKKHPYRLRFQVDRSGAPVYVKFLTNKISEVKDANSFREGN